MSNTKNKRRRLVHVKILIIEKLENKIRQRSTVKIVVINDRKQVAFALIQIHFDIFAAIKPSKQVDVVLSNINPIFSFLKSLILS